jgi:hypothetical protein
VLSLRQKLNVHEYCGAQGHAFIQHTHKTGARASAQTLFFGGHALRTGLEHKTANTSHLTPHMCAGSDVAPYRKSRRRISAIARYSIRSKYEARVCTWLAYECAGVADVSRPSRHICYDVCSHTDPFSRKGTHAHPHAYTCMLTHHTDMHARKTVFEARGGIYFKNPDKAHKSGEKAGRGYMHMIRLYSGMLFHHPVLHAFDNYMRLDTDSFFVGETKVSCLD